MNDNFVYLMRKPIGLPKAAKLEILEVIDNSRLDCIDESIYPGIQCILEKYGFVLVIEPELCIKKRPELPVAL